MYVSQLHRLHSTTGIQSAIFMMNCHEGARMVPQSYFCGPDLTTVLKHKLYLGDTEAEEIRGLRDLQSEAIRMQRSATKRRKRRRPDFNSTYFLVHDDPFPTVDLGHVP